jgi:hypothetical protein
MARKSTSPTRRKTAAPPRAKARRRNPDDTAAAADLFEQFHGAPATHVTAIRELDRERTELAELGRLIQLHVLLPGNKLAVLKPRGVRVGAAGDGGQIYFVGGDQALDLEQFGLAKALPKDHVLIGEADYIEYYTTKAFHNFEPTIYQHHFGEESGVLPALNYDVLNRQFYLSGGRYQVRPEGIVD